MSRRRVFCGTIQAAIVVFRDVVDDEIAHDRHVPVSAIVSAATPPPTAPTSSVPRPPRHPPASSGRPMSAKAGLIHGRAVAPTESRRGAFPHRDGTGRTAPSSLAGVPPPWRPGVHRPAGEGTDGAWPHHRGGPHDRRPLPPPSGHPETATAKGVRRRAQPRPRRSGRGDAPGRPRPSPGLAKA